MAGWIGPMGVGSGAGMTPPPMLAILAMIISMVLLDLQGTELFGPRVTISNLLTRLYDERDEKRSLRPSGVVGWEARNH